MNFARLDRLAAQYEQVLIHRHGWEKVGHNTRQEHKILKEIHAQYPKIKLCAVETVSTSSGDPTWHESLTKFLTFAPIEHPRVFVFDSGPIFQNNMDHYFFVPLTPPGAYWLNYKDASAKDQILASHTMLVEPNRVTIIVLWTRRNRLATLIWRS
ncbi:hypothetical protein ETB97_002065 [Aspergillus alliaceus]|uniref:Uncharacterized protein n=1 Tax=Petromyces alliaceus TaxID=209559 RepID=A0A8H6E5D5_PETAA|nr:hypothetical protein ETB97_002065 [Aspergillus burnettii]